MYRTILTALSRLFSIFMLLALVSCGSGDTSANKETVAPVAGIRAITASGAVSDTIYVLPETGWYWNPAEGGRGFAIERQGDKIFLSGFLYESNGHPTWYVTTMEMQSNKQFIGSLARFAGGQSLTGDYKGATQSQVGYAVLSFTSATEGTLYVTPDTGENAITVKLQRFPISTPVPFQASAASFQNGWWWSDKEGGRGYFIEVQGNQAFIGSFMYDNAGEPTWYVSSATLSAPNKLSGSLQEYAGGQTLIGGYKSAGLKANAGDMSFNFTAADAATMTLPNGKPVQLSRFGFSTSTSSTPPSISCTSPQILQNGSCVTATAPVPIRPVFYFTITPVQSGNYYGVMLCYAGPYDCDTLVNSIFVSNEELQDPDTAEALIYAKSVAEEFRQIIDRLWRAKTYPSNTALAAAFRTAIQNNLANRGKTAVNDATNYLMTAGYPAASTAAPVTPTCYAPQIPQNGVCVTPPTPVTCKAPQILSNGSCVTPLPLDVRPIYGAYGIATPQNHKQFSDAICDSWQVIGAPVVLSTCTTKSGYWGYEVIENRSATTAKICYKAYFHSGAAPDKGCYSNMQTLEMRTPYCPDCASKKGGARQIDLTEFTPQ